MSQIIRYLTHPEVQIDPQKDIQRWSLNVRGAARIRALARSGALNGTRWIISSDETKAIETATPLAQSLGCEVEIHPDMHENDRSATGFLPADEFEQVANAFFAAPEKSTHGWETAIAAQSRILAAYDQALKQFTQGDILFVGHGAVGTLLYCYLTGQKIDRKHDQQMGGGCYFEHIRDQPPDAIGWRTLEDMIRV